MHRVARGFTLLELLVVLAIAAVLTGIAIPGFRTAIQQAEIRDAATSFYSALTRARSEAIARNTPVAVCARNIGDPSSPSCSNDNTAWQNGWLVFATATPGTTLLLHAPIADGLSLGTVASPLQFDATGRVATETTFDLCRAADTRGRRITVSRSGRVALAPHTC